MTLGLIGYLVLCLVVAVMAVLLLGTMREVALLSRPAPNVPPTEADDGPALGSMIPHLRFESDNGFGPIDTRGPERGENTVILFVSPLCEGCQDTVGVLNAALRQGIRVRPIILLSGSDRVCRSFLNLFPIDAPVKIDTDYSQTDQFSITNRPFGLLYDSTGKLVRKKLLVSPGDMEVFIDVESGAPGENIAVVG
jgi:hypothetical protein